MTKNERIKEIRQQIIQLQNKIFEQQIADNFYYSSGKYREAQCELRDLERELESLESE